jgi:head-tail joining protein
MENRLEQTGAGSLYYRVAFDRREEIDDGFGNTVSGPWQEQFQKQAQFMFGRGSEAIMAARLDNRSPMTVRIRMSQDTRQIDTDWQMRDVRAGGLPYNIRDITWDNSRAFIELVVEGGVAT